MAKQVGIYARVSTDGQTKENQLRELRAVAERHGWVIRQEFVDKGISGAKGREPRPAFHALCNDVARREVHLVAGSAVDRLGRSLQHLVAFLRESRAQRVASYTQHRG